MTNTEVTLVSSDGTFVPSVDSVNVISGDTVSFSTADGSPALAFFSPDAIAALSPKPNSPFPIAAGKKAAFSFTTSQPGSYSAFFTQDTGSAPARFPSGDSAVLRLEVAPSVVPGFPGPGDGMRTGHGS